MFNYHEKVCTNDCLLNFKYQYEFTTNYDFDEIIFPRKFLTNDHTYFNSAQNCTSSLDNFNFNYSMYDYAMRLSQLYGKNIGYFRFENVVFLTSYEAKFLQNMLTVSNRIVFFENSGNRISLTISPSHFKKIDEIFELQQFIECLNETILNHGKFQNLWNVPYAILINNRLGKSLYNTNLTITYNQHHSDYLEPEARYFNVPIDDGYVSHIKTDIYGFLRGQKYSFTNFRLDMEYYHFLAHLSMIDIN